MLKSTVFGVYHNPLQISMVQILFFSSLFISSMPFFPLHSIYFPIEMRLELSLRIAKFLNHNSLNMIGRIIFTLERGCMFIQVTLYIFPPYLQVTLFYWISERHCAVKIKKIDFGMDWPRHITQLCNLKVYDLEAFTLLLNVSVFL